MGVSSIEWTDRTWNPVTGCVKVSPGCKNCYAETVANRFWKGRKFTDVRTHDDRLEQPLHWRKPSKIFVNSMSDLFHEDVPFEFIDKVFAVMALCPQHTFQVLTKRPERMLEYFADRPRLCKIQYAKEVITGEMPSGIWTGSWPIHNVWLGVSVENQEYADKRIPLLLQAPAAIRFCSYEPALGPVDFTKLRHDLLAPSNGLQRVLGDEQEFNAIRGERIQGRIGYSYQKLDWIIVGGESGAGARTFNIEWARAVLRQCGYGYRSSRPEVQVFVKQLGARIRPGESFDTFIRNNPIVGNWRCNTGGGPGNAYLRTPDRKGGDMSEWPEDLRVREFPKETRP